MGKTNMGKTRSSVVLWIAFTALAAIGWSGCSKAGLNSVSPNGTQSSTYVELMNMAPFAPSTEIYLNNIQSTGAVAPGSYSNSYEPLIPGDYDINFKIAGSDSVLADIPSSPYDSLSFYTLLLYNTDTVTKAIKALKIQDDFSKVTSSSTYFRFFDLCPDLAAVDLYINGQLVQQHRTPADIAEGGTSFTAFQAMAPAIFNLAATVSGSTIAIAVTNNNYFLAGSASTVILSGSASNPNFPITLYVVAATY